MRNLGTVQVPTEAFMAVLKLDSDGSFCLPARGSAPGACWHKNYNPFTGKTELLRQSMRRCNV